MTFIATIAFALLLLLSLAHQTVRARLGARKLDEWLIDLIGLANQGFVASLVLGWLVAKALTAIWPETAGLITTSPVLGFFVSLFTFDYAFYWSHRLFHQQRLFAIHFIHHTSERMDILASARNSLWQPFLFPHVWLIAIVLHLSHDPLPVILALEVMGAFDYWNHSGLHPRSRWLYAALQKVFITPRAHEWHHSQRKYRTNYGNVFSLWDRLHGTYYGRGEEPERVGLPLRENSWWRMLIHPYRRPR